MMKNKKKTLGILGIIIFVSSIIFVKVANVYDLFLENRVIVTLILSIVFFISIVFIFRYINTLDFK